MSSLYAVLMEYPLMVIPIYWGWCYTNSCIRDMWIGKCHECKKRHECLEMNEELADIRRRMNTITRNLTEDKKDSDNEGVGME